MSNCIKKLFFHIKLLKTGFVAKDKWRQAPGFVLLDHIMSTRLPAQIYAHMS